MNNLLKVLGNRLKLRRQEMGYSQEKLAELAGLHPTHIGRIERAEKTVTIKSLYKIVKILGLSMEELFKNF
ncbi:MAG: helix-turn-helix domain-containing protein [Candidatus Gastranaerophilaceae bacterium]